MRSLPNIISTLRIFLVIPTVYFLLNDRHSYALLVFLIAGLSDGLDGYLARRYGWTTRLGSFLDPMGDKLLMTATYFVLGWLGHLPVWLVAVVIGRDVVIVLGALAYRLLVQDISMKPLLISKINTLCQIALALLMLYSLSDLPLAGSAPVEWLTHWLVYVVFITALLSGVAYVYIWSRKAAHDVNKRGNA
jgi:cardiolipin synthase (CMP-forming)